MQRNLYKLYGVRMVIRIVGQGNRFSFFQTIITVGSSAALFSVATIIVDLLLTTIWAKKSDYENKKYDHLWSLGGQKRESAEGHTTTSYEVIGKK